MFIIKNDMGTDCILVQKVSDNEYNVHSLDRFRVFEDFPYINPDSDYPTFYTEKDKALEWFDSHDWEDLRANDSYKAEWLSVAAKIIDESDLPFHIAYDNDYDYLLEEGLKINKFYP